MEKTAGRYLWHYAAKFKFYFLSALIFSIIAQICAQTYPYYLAKIYETVSKEYGNPEIWAHVFYFASLAAALGIGRVLFMEIPSVINAKSAPAANTLATRDAFDYVNKHSIAYFNNEMSGNVANKVTQLTSGTTEFFNLFLQICYDGLKVIVTFAILSWLSSWFLAAMIIWIACISFIGVKLGDKRREIAKVTSHLQSQANGMIVDSLANYSEIKSFANFKFERLNLLKYLRILRHAQTREMKVRTWIHFALNLSTYISIFAFVFLSVYMLKIGKIDVVIFIYANSLFYELSFSFFAITYGYNHTTRVLGQIESALETIAVEPEIKDKPNAVKPKFKKAAISLENVDFAYNSKENLFKNFSIEIKAGEKVGLVGLSGSGKSSFVKLIARYFDVQNGAVKINGIDVRDIAQDSLHKNIAAIPQDVCLFNRTLLENIRYGKTNASEEEVIKAAKKASADEFIKAFPNGYQTKVGERGVVLSGGERQRIAIARAILKNAPILIFDEATSALDSQSEKHIQKSLNNLMKNKTVIAIAHRLSTLREMDRILVFDKGHIVEQGTHAALLRKKGVYYKFYNMQADGFVGVAAKASEPSKAL